MSDLPHVFGRLMELKRCFPESDISRMVLRTQLWLLADDADMSEVIQVASEFRTQFPSSDIDRYIVRRTLVFCCTHLEEMYDPTPITCGSCIMFSLWRCLLCEIHYRVGTLRGIVMCISISIKAFSFGIPWCCGSLILIFRG